MLSHIDILANLCYYQNAFSLVGGAGMEQAAAKRLVVNSGVLIKKWRPAVYLMWGGKYIKLTEIAEILGCTPEAAFVFMRGKNQGLHWATSRETCCGGKTACFRVPDKFEDAYLSHTALGFLPNQ